MPCRVSSDSKSLNLGMAMDHKRTTLNSGHHTGQPARLQRFGSSPSESPACKDELRKHSPSLSSLLLVVQPLDAGQELVEVLRAQRMKDFNHF